MSRRVRIHKVLICGDRNYKKKYARIVRREIRALKKEYGERRLVIIAGGAPGVDTLAEECAHRENVHTARVDALWDTRHRSAGNQRNEIMAALEPHEVIGVHDDIKSSRGTKDMLKLAEELGIPNRLVSE